MSKLKRTLIGMFILALFGLPVAPHRASAQAATKTYDVTVTNITNSKQVLSPLLVATHPPSVHAWQLGQLASKGLELLAREGMPDLLASELKGVATDVQMTQAPLMPGNSVTVRVNAKEGDVLSAATMLVQTNDGFTGLDSVPLSGSMIEKDTVAYDGGVEDNTELAADVPGPPFGGKNHGPDTNPRQPISIHQGIKGVGDVTPDFNWSGPVARFTISPVSSSTSSMPGMPQTGVADYTIWLIAALGAVALFAGLGLRRMATVRRH